MCGHVCTCLCVHCSACVHLPVSLSLPPLRAVPRQVDLVVWGLPALVAVSERGPCGPPCRFSHGQVVSVDELRPFQDPDLSSLQAGSACLAKQPDGLWCPARITGEDARGPRSGPAGRPPLLTRCSPMTIPSVGCWVPAPCPGGARLPRPWPTLLPTQWVCSCKAADLACLSRLQMWTVATTQSGLTPCC